uniref:Large ribosomal subunit protein bL12 C-terminal domain-containing protein n=1 Tax=Oncorhynchus tshawytscha TaxID=74940 RepID=A0AAZ3Q7N9_ONCTS
MPVVTPYTCPVVTPTRCPVVTPYWCPWLPLTRCPVVTPGTRCPVVTPYTDAPWSVCLCDVTAIQGFPVMSQPKAYTVPRGHPLHGAPWSSPVAVEEDAAPVKKEKTHFTVKLTELKAAEKVKLIKEVKNSIQGLNLVQAKKLVESLPQEIRANVSKEEAEKLKTALETAGGTVVLE